VPRAHPAPEHHLIRIALLLCLHAAPALAQDPDVQKQLMERQQRTDAFNLQLRQQQEALKAAPADRQALEARQFSERQRLDNLSNQQLRDVRPDAPQSYRPYERQNADREREPFRGPIVEVPVTPAPKARPIVPPRSGIRLEEERQEGRK
jgi:hypothetical protein